MVWLALGTVYIVWGSTYLAIAFAVQTMPPFLAAAIRFVVAGAMLAAWIAIRDRDALRVDRGQLLGASAVGVLLLAGGNALVMLGERSVPSGLAALIVASVPLWIVIMRLVAGDRVRGDVVGGVLVGLAGVAVLVVPSGMNGTLDIVGVLALLGATLSWATGTFLSQRLRMPRSALTSTALQMLAAGIVLTIVAFPIGDYARASASGPSVTSLVALGYLVVFGSLVGFSAYTWVLQHAPISLVSTYAYVNPVVAVILGTLVLSEPITPTMAGGAALILAAVAFIVSRSSRPATASATRATLAPTVARSPSARD